MKAPSKLPDWTKFWMTKEKKIELNGIPVSCFSCSFEGSGFNPTFSSLGVDPGKNFGITWIDCENQEIRIYNGEMPAGTHESHGIFAIDLIQDFCSYHCIFVDDESAIEGASYGSTFGQVGLAEIRFGFYVGLQKLGMTTQVIPPASVRKAVFGSAKIHAGDIWPILNHNAADSLGVALYPYFGERKVV